MSTSLLLGYESVLRRPQHLTRARASEWDITEVLDALAGLCVPVTIDFRWRPSGAHADDDLVVETAINGHADAVATFHVKHMHTAASRFGFAVMLPGPIVRGMRQ